MQKQRESDKEIHLTHTVVHLPTTNNRIFDRKQDLTLKSTYICTTAVLVVLRNRKKRFVKEFCLFFNVINDINISWSVIFK